MGRPKTLPDDHKLVAVRVAPETAAWLTKRAKRDGCTVSDVLRHLLENAAWSDAPT